MKKAYIYTAIAFIAVLGSACSKSPVADETGTGEYKIGFGMIDVKASDELTPDESKSTQINVYDYFTKTGETTEIEYINDVIQATSNDDAPWAYVSGSSYAWKAGAHEFIGWVSKDENQVAAPGVFYTDKIITVDDGTELPGTYNFDYIYSRDTVVNWTVALEDTPVELKMQHLSSALTYEVKNNIADDSYEVTGITVENIVTTARATVTYPGENGGEVVEYNLGTTKGNVGLFLGDNAKTMVWPQEVKDAKLTVNYNYTENNETISKRGTVDIPDIEWQAGYVYKFVIEVVNKSLELTFKVLPWDLVDETIDTSTGSINMSNVTWMNTKLMVNETLTNTVDNSGYSVTMYKDPYFPVASTYSEIVYQTYEADVYDEDEVTIIHHAGEQVLYEADVYQTYEEDVYQTYEEDVYDEDKVTIIHHAGDKVLDEDNNPIVLHHAGDKVLDEENNPIVLHHAGDPIVLHNIGDPVLDENGDQVYENGTQYSGYYPAQGFFTVNYPEKGKFFIGLIPAYGETEVDEKAYEIRIYDKSTKAFRLMDNVDGEVFSRTTVYFQVRAAANQNHAEHKAQINIWFIPDGETEKISAYSEIRANYALVIPATATN